MERVQYRWVCYCTLPTEVNLHKWKAQYIIVRNVSYVTLQVPIFLVGAQWL